MAKLLTKQLKQAEDKYLEAMDTLKYEKPKREKALKLLQQAKKYGKIAGYNPTKQYEKIEKKYRISTKEPKKVVQKPSKNKPEYAIYWKDEGTGITEWIPEKFVTGGKKYSSYKEAQKDKTKLQKNILTNYGSKHKHKVVKISTNDIGVPMSKAEENNLKKQIVNNLKETKEKHYVKGNIYKGEHWSLALEKASKDPDVYLEPVIKETKESEGRPLLADSDYEVKHYQLRVAGSKYAKYKTKIPKHYEKEALKLFKRNKPENIQDIKKRKTQFKIKENTTSNFTKTPKQRKPITDHSKELKEEYNIVRSLQRIQKRYKKYLEYNENPKITKDKKERTKRLFKKDLNIILKNKNISMKKPYIETIKKQEVYYRPKKKYTKSDQKLNISKPYQYIHTPEKFETKTKTITIKNKKLGGLMFEGKFFSATKKIDFDPRNIKL